MGFWSELGEALGLRERTPNRGRHAQGRARVPAGPPANSRNATRIKYGREGKPGRARVQLEERRANQPKPFRGVAKVEPKLRTRNPSANARANVGARKTTPPGYGDSLASRIHRAPAELWWHGSGR